jgi:hypothetical protein
MFTINERTCKLHPSTSTTQFYSLLSLFSTLTLTPFIVHHSPLAPPPLLSHCRWGEVDFLLRRRIESEEDIEYTTAAAEAGLLFIDQVHELLLRSILC